MPKIVDRFEYKKELLQKCFNLFSKKGFSNVTMREIASEIGVSTGTLYHYFPTKDDILEKMISYIQEKNVGDLVKVVNQDDTIEKRVDSIINFWNDNQEYYQNVMLLAIDLYRNKKNKIEKIFKDFYNYYANALSDKFNISEKFSKAIIIQLIGLIFHSILNPEKVSYDDQLDIIKDVLISIFHTNEDKSENTKENVKEILFNIISNNKKN